MTKTGNEHARMLLVEAAWHHQKQYWPGKAMRERWDLAPAAARARGDPGTGAWPGGSGSTNAADGTSLPRCHRLRWPASLPGGAGPSQSCPTNPLTCS